MSKKIIFTSNDELLTTYMKEISKYKVLDNSTINDLIRLAQKGDDKARNKIINSNLRFVITIAKNFQNRGVPLMDLISNGNEGLCKSIDKYDPDREIPFISYAAWWIKQCIYNDIYKNGKEIRLPNSQQLLVIKILDTTTKFLQENHREPSSVELSELTGIPREQIDYLSQFSNTNISVDDFIGGDEENSQVCDVIPDESILPDDLVDREFVTKEILNILNNLSIRERDIIIMLYGIGMNPVNSKLVAEMFGLGNERVRQIKESALSKLKRRFHKILKKIR